MDREEGYYCNWGRVVELDQEVFLWGYILKAINWFLMALISEGGCDPQVIGLMEVI